MQPTMDALKRLSGIIGESEAIHEVLQTIAQIAPTDITVLVTGESGTGKERIAKAIHKLSRRKHEPIVTVNCGAIPVGIIESELFGHKKGSFTGAENTRKGYFEAADKGTIFLDEIGETPRETQVKLLRVIEQGEFIRVGDNVTQHVDVRIVAATNRDLADDVRKDLFRQDLYYRLKTVTIHMPPLRDHLDDIAMLVERFGLEFSTRNDLPYKGFTPEGLKYLKGFDWPGNVRELKNVTESVLALHPGVRITPAEIQQQLKVGDYVGNRSLPVLVETSPEQSERELILRQLLFIRQDVSDLRQFIAGRGGIGSQVDPYMATQYSSGGSVKAEEVFTGDIANLEHKSFIDAEVIGEVTMEELEMEFIQLTLEKYNHNRRRTADALGIAERTLYRKIQAYNLEKK